MRRTGIVKFVLLLKEYCSPCAFYSLAFLRNLCAAVVMNALQSCRGQTVYFVANGMECFIVELHWSLKRGHSCVFLSLLGVLSKMTLFTVFVPWCINPMCYCSSLINLHFYSSKSLWGMIQQIPHCYLNTTIFSGFLKSQLYLTIYLPLFWYKQLQCCSKQTTHPIVKRT